MVATMTGLPVFEDVLAAAGRIDGQAHRTPVMTSRRIDRETGAKLFFKCENFQRTGAFKFRGALNALSRFDETQRKAGVITFSSGNHGQAIALAASLLGIAATIVMPQDAPASKVAATRGYGGRIVTYDRYRDDRDAIVRDFAEKTGVISIPPYDHPDIIAGQGTAARELFEEAGALDALFVCLGGGGLISGCALAAAALSPGCKVYGVEPENGNDGQQSFRSGSIVRIATPQTIADGAQTTALGALTFAIIRREVEDILDVSDTELVEAMKILASTMKMVVEPTGCLAFAGARKAIGNFAGKRIGIIVSGGNVDLERFSALVSTG